MSGIIDCGDYGMEYYTALLENAPNKLIKSLYICIPVLAPVAIFAYFMLEDSIKAKALFERGVAYADKGDYDKDIEDFEAVLKIDPNNAEVKQLLEEVQSNKAIKDLSATLKIKPDDIVTLVLRGIAYHEKGNYDKAINDFEAALKMDPNDTYAKQFLEEIRQTKAGIKK